MKRLIIILGLLLPAVFLSVSQGVAAPRLKNWTGSRGWGAEAPYVRLYNVKTVETVRGMVTAVQRFIPGRGMSAGVRILVRVGIDVMDVHLGPEWFIENQDLMIHPKDQVEVKGSKVFFRAQPALIASELIKGDNIMRLRDENGFPAWIAWRRH
ncbi:MAG TPA: hypothetical protein VGJ94_15835 [Syntrophorhabdaceae bacterium]|jgi:hypothetical protein